MKHELIGEPLTLSPHISEITIRLFPENEIEATAIKNSEVMWASAAESELINKYFLFNIPGWSVLSIKSQDGATFRLKASDI